MLNFVRKLFTKTPYLPDDAVLCWSSASTKYLYNLSNRIEKKPDLSKLRVWHDAPPGSSAMVGICGFHGYSSPLYAFATSGVPYIYRMALSGSVDIDHEHGAYAGTSRMLLWRIVDQETLIDAYTSAARTMMLSMPTHLNFKTKHFDWPRECDCFFYEQHEYDHEKIREGAYLIINEHSDIRKKENFIIRQAGNFMYGSAQPDGFVRSLTHWTSFIKFLTWQFYDFKVKPNYQEAVRFHNYYRLMEVVLEDTYRKYALKDTPRKVVEL